MSENVQEGEKGQELSSEKDVLDEIVALLEETGLPQEGDDNLSLDGLAEKATEVKNKLEEVLEQISTLV